MAESMWRFGQLVPVVVSTRQEVLAVVGGFRRLYAARQISLERLEVRELPLSDKAAGSSASGAEPLGPNATE